MVQRMPMYTLEYHTLKQYVVMDILVILPIVGVSYHNCATININNIIVQQCVILFAVMVGIVSHQTIVYAQLVIQDKDVKRVNETKSENT